MLKKIFFIILSFNLLSHCDYKPVYLNKDEINYKVVIMSFNGDKIINNFIAANLKKSSKESSKEILKISFDSKYTKSILAKNAAGKITDYQTKALVSFEVIKGDDLENFKISEKFNFQKINDKYEEKNYEQNIKRNLANSISQKLMLKLAMNQ